MWRLLRFLALLVDPVAGAGGTGYGREQLSPVFCLLEPGYAL